MQIRQQAHPTELPPGLSELEFAILTDNFPGFIKAYFEAADDHDLKAALCLAASFKSDICQLLIAVGASKAEAETLAITNGKRDIATYIAALVPDENVRIFIACYLIQTYRDDLPERYKEKIHDFLKTVPASSVFEFATYLNQNELVKNLITANPNLRQNPLIRTPGYWAAINGEDELFELCTQDAKDKYYTFWQLERDADDHVIKKYVKKNAGYYSAKEMIRREYDESKLDTISETCAEGYKALCKGSEREYVRNISNISDDATLATLALKHNNYVALFQIIKRNKNTPRAAQLFFEIIKHPSLSRFFRLMHSVSCHELCLIEPKIMDALNITHGLLYSLFLNQSFVAHQRLDLEFYRKIPKRDVDVFNCLIHALSLYHPENIAYQKLLEDQEEKNLKQRLKAALISPEDLSRLNNFFSKFSLGISYRSVTEESKQERRKSSLPPEILFSVFEMLMESKEQPGQRNDLHPKVVFSTLSKPFAREFFNQTHKNNLEDYTHKLIEREKKAEDNLKQIELKINTHTHILAKINECNNTLEKDGHSPFNKPRMYCAFTTLTLWILFSLSIKYMYDLKHHENSEDDNILVDFLNIAVIMFGPLVTGCVGLAYCWGLLCLDTEDLQLDDDMSVNYYSSNAFRLYEDLVITLNQTYPNHHQLNIESLSVNDLRTFLRETKAQESQRLEQTVSKKVSLIHEEKLKLKKKRTLLKALFPDKAQQQAAQQQALPAELLQIVVHAPVEHVPTVARQIEEEEDDRASLLRAGERAPSRSFSSRRGDL